MAIHLENLKNLKQGMKKLTPVQLAEGRIAGYVGMVVGLILATITTFLNKSYGIGIFLFFLTWFQGVGLVSECKAYWNLKEMQKMIDENQDKIDKIMEG